MTAAMLGPWPTKLLTANQQERPRTGILIEEAYYLTSLVKGYRGVLVQVKIIQDRNTQTEHMWGVQHPR